MHHLYNRGMSRSEIAALAPLVVAAAENGDGVANGLLDEAAHDLAVCVTAVATHLHLLEQSELVLIGGLLTNTTAVSHRLAASLAHQLPTCYLTVAELPPVLGASLQAMLSQNKTVSAVVLHNLTASRIP
jgi:N-acetylglucosamine kinase-like BadF-type ATPase